MAAMPQSRMGLMSRLLLSAMRPEIEIPRSLPSSPSDWQVVDYTRSWEGPSSIHHWQLRNLLKPAGSLVAEEDRENSVVFIHERKICVITMSNFMSTPKEIAVLNFLPYCFDCAEGFLVVAGESGKISVFEIENE